MPSILVTGATGRWLAEDAAFGLRWIEIVTGITIDPRVSLVELVAIKPIDAVRA